MDMGWTRFTHTIKTFVTEIPKCLQKHLKHSSGATRQDPMSIDEHSYPVTSAAHMKLHSAEPLRHPSKWPKVPQESPPNLQYAQSGTRLPTPLIPHPSAAQAPEAFWASHNYKQQHNTLFDSSLLKKALLMRFVTHVCEHSTVWPCNSSINQTKALAPKKFILGGGLEPLFQPLPRGGGLQGPALFFPCFSCIFHDKTTGTVTVCPCPRHCPCVTPRGGRGLLLCFSAVLIHPCPPAPPHKQVGAKIFRYLH